MGKKKCEDEKKRDAATFNAQHDYFGKLYDAKEDFIKAGKDWYKYCDAEKLKKLSGTKLEGAQNACEDAKEVFEKAITHFEKVRTEYTKLEDVHNEAAKALSDCEHKKKKGKK